MNKDKKEIEEQEKKYKKEMTLLYGAIAKDGKYQKTSNIAKLFKLSVRRIQQLTQEGILQTEETDEGRRYELCPTVQRYSEYLSSKAYGKSSTEKEIQLKQQKLEAEIELKELQGDFHKIKNDIAAGRYISVEDVKADYRKFFVTFKKFALGIPSKLSTRLSSVCDSPSEIRAIESELNNDIITLLSNFVVAGYSEEVTTPQGGDKSGKKKAVTKNKKI